MSNLARYRRRHDRRGAAAILMCVLMVPLLFLLAFGIDYGFLLYVETNLQRSSDQAALAGVRELVPDEYGFQDPAAVRAAVRDYVELNLGDGFSVDDQDIEIGRYNPDTIYGDLQLLDDGILDTVRVTLRRNDTANRSVSLYFARLFGNDEAGVVAQSTAVLQKARYIGPGTGVLPFGIQASAWRHLDFGDEVSIYGAGQLLDADGNQVPGNWGTLDIGPTSNSAADLSNQIIHGLTQGDLDSLHAAGTIDTAEYIDSQIEIELNGDTGFSSGLKHAVDDVYRVTKVAPIYKRVHDKGGNLYFTISGWVSLKVLDSAWNGSQRSYITVRKSYAYDENLRPINDLSNPVNTIEGAYTSPVLVQ